MDTSHQQHQRDQRHQGQHGASADHRHAAGDAHASHLEAESRLAEADRTALMAAAAAALDAEPHLIVDLGSGVGDDAIALARFFPTATVYALDVSHSLLGRVSDAADAAGLTDRIEPRHVDLNDDWRSVVPSGVDLVWAALSLHHLQDPATALSQVRAALRPGGLIVVVESTGEVRVDPPDLGTGIAGLGDAVASRLVPPAEFTGHDWGELLAAAGLPPIRHHRYDLRADAGTPEGVAYLQVTLGAVRDPLIADLSSDDARRFDAMIEALTDSDARLSLTSTRATWLAARAGRDADADQVVP